MSHTHDQLEAMADALLWDQRHSACNFSPLDTEVLLFLDKGSASTRQIANAIKRNIDSVRSSLEKLLAKGSVRLLETREQPGTIIKTNVWESCIEVEDDGPSYLTHSQLRDRRRKEVYPSSGVPEPAIASGIYNRAGRDL